MDTETPAQLDPDPAPEPGSEPELTQESRPPFRVMVLRFLLAAEILLLILSLGLVIAHKDPSAPLTRNTAVEEDIPWHSQLSTMSRLTGPKADRPAVGTTRQEILAILSMTVACALLLPLAVVSLASAEVSPRLARAGLWTTGFALAPAVLLPAIARAREKPVIYLYPETETLVSVKLDYDGVFTETIPPYPRDGWRVIASQSGELTDPESGAKYPYLFWEGRDTHVYAMKDGFVVPGTDTAAFLNQALSDLGLSAKEIADFTEYWVPRMTPNRFNFIHFATDEYDRHVPLHVTPKPDTVIRVFMLFRALDTSIDVTPQRLTKIERKGFTVVEWGGTELTRWQLTHR